METLQECCNIFVCVCGCVCVYLHPCLCCVYMFVFHLFRTSLFTFAKLSGLAKERLEPFKTVSEECHSLMIEARMKKCAPERRRYDLMKLHYRERILLISYSISLPTVIVINLLSSLTLP